MKISQELNNITKIGDFGKQKKFSIEANSQAFRLLSDKIYSNKIRSIIREISCNSYDSHKLFGTIDLPFDVHLPNSLSPKFSIRDYGVGLSEEDVFGIYSTFCSSNKTNSNDYIGQLGIGSKSPFCYTDQFSIISYFNGEKLFFSAHIAEDSCPSIVLLNREKTLEKNGLEISFSVRKNDIDNFAREANFVYSLWEPIKPNITGNKIDLDVFTPTIQSLDNDPFKWMLGGNIPDNYAVMGNIKYHINFDDPIYENEHIEKIYNKLLYHNHIVLWFNIGELDITASREELSYSKKTIKALKDKLDSVYGIIRQRLEDDVKKNARNYWEACTYYAKSRLLYQSFGLVDLEFNGKKLEQYIRIYNQDYSAKFPDIIIKHARKCRSKVVLDNEKNYIDLPAELYINDLDNNNGVRRLKELYQSKKYDDPNIYLVQSQNEMAEKEFLDYLELDKSIFKLTSQLPEPPKNATATRAKTIQIYKWRDGYWNEEKIDIATATDIFSFVKLHRFEIIDKEKGNIAKTDFRYVIRSLENLGISLDNIVGVRKAVYNKVINLTNWRPFSEVVREKYEAFISSEKLEDILPILESNTASYYQLLEDHWKILRREIECKEFQKIFATIELVEKYADNLGDLTKIQKFLNGEQDSLQREEFNVNDRFDNLVRSHYPMLEFVKNWYRYQNSEIDYVKETINYINYLYNQFKQTEISEGAATILC